ncbi:MAG: hypothetical protein GTN38_01815 [Candidatus Aenigmarchaeota archaeon]|nr:hypothetical protein [Candidatus Aenigmarchaeota archaeon]NIP40294.1 hypothetical protein [Candidatus Aenigmarchaeota archaeon]NIQ17786.1 hypothetical protein [Candidatus Aenigmarchaeota archaeon]NIS73169.1 hypothetical protein [Candidatus Aenigmarchaeota archaeon]
MKHITLFLILMCVIIITLISGCVTRDAGDLVFTEEELRSMGYDVQRTEEYYDGVWENFDGFVSGTQRVYRIGWQEGKYEGEIVFQVVIFDNEVNSQKSYSTRVDYAFLTSKVPCEQSTLGDESCCYEANGSYDCLARYGENDIFLRVLDLDRTFEDVEELMNVFEEKIN